MNFYNHKIESNITYVDIDKILLSQPIINAVENLGKKIVNPNIDPFAPAFGKLERLNSFNNFVNIILPPVVLKKYQNYYTIIDGRHRIALSLYNNFTQIPAILYSC